MCEVLTALDYLDGDTVTERGGHLRRIYSDVDLLAAESLRHGLWDDLRPVGPRRGAVDPGLRGPPPRRRQLATDPRRSGQGGHRPRWSGCGASCDALEREHQLDFLREPDLGFAWAAYRWAEGDDLDSVLAATDLAAGDFVRWMKQLLDLAGQVADAAGDSPAARDRPRGGRAGCAAAWWPTPGSAD